jgi:hypothetical protein
MEDAFYTLTLSMIAEGAKNGSGNTGINGNALGPSSHPLHHQVVSEH